MLWILLTLCLGVAAAFAALPLLRTEPVSSAANNRARLYQQQIDEVDNEEAQGVITTPEAAALRVEAQRRLLAASTNNQTKEAQMPLSRTTTALAIAGMVIAGGVGLYAAKGRPTVSSASRPTIAATAEPQTGPAAPQTVSSVDGMVDGLAARLKDNPDDTEGWRMLGWSYFSMERYPEAVDAYEHAVALAPDNSDFQSVYGESLVMASGGYVTGKALDVFKTTLDLNPDDPRARFFMGLALDQAGDPGAAISTWLNMINTAPAGADWVPDLRQRVEARALEAGIDIGGRLAAAPETAAPRGPSMEQIQNAMALPADDQQAMIEGMVASLAARLKENPDDPEGWIRLIRSKTVLGRQSEAVADLKMAISAFEEAPETRARIIAEAEALGVRVQ